MYAEEAIEIGLSIKQLWMLGYNPLLYAAEIVPIHTIGLLRKGICGMERVVSIAIAVYYVSGFCAKTKSMPLKSRMRHSLSDVHRMPVLRKAQI